MRFLRQNTAVLVTVGPIIDDTDGLTPLDAATVTGITGCLSYDDDDGTAGAHFDFTCSASGGDNDLVAVGHNGLWTLELTAAQTNFVGRAILSLTDPDQICPTFHEFTALPANVYDALKGTDKLAVHADEITNGLITAAAIATGAIDADAIADNAIDAGAIATGAITNAKFAAGAIDAAAVADGAIDAATFAAGAINAAAIANGAIDNATFAADVGSTAYATNIIALAADKALVQQNLDHLAAVATAGADMTTEVADNTILSRIIANGDTSAFDPSTDGLQPLKDALATEADIAAAILATPANLLVTDASGHVTLANGAHGGAAAVVTLQTPIVANATQIEGGDATDAITAAATASLNTYDPPTKAELDTAQGAVTLANGAHGGAAATLTLSGAAGLVATKIDAAFNGALTGNITGNLSGSVGSVTGAVGSVASGGITATSIAADAIGASELAADAASEIADALLAKVVEAQGSYTVQQVLSIVLSVLAGVTADNGATLKSPNGSATRVAATIDGNKNRTGMVLTPSA